MANLSRRGFLSQLAGVCAGGALSSTAQGRQPRWIDRLGLQVFTVRDRLKQDFEDTFARIAEAGYKEVELIGPLGGRSPKEVRAILDRNGLAAVSTHIRLSAGPDVERQLEGWHVMGHRFTQVRATTVAGTSPADAFRRLADAANQIGSAGKKYGIRALLHNQVAEFVPLDGGATGYDILLRETDPNLVVMELDIGWASAAGQNVIDMFRKNSGRYALWHVKGVTGLAALHTKPLSERQRHAQFVPVGTGDIDYKRIFEAAPIAGLQHYFIEQDNAIDFDSMALIRTNAANLKRLLN